MIFIIHGEPQGKQRAKTVRNKHTGRSVSYTPEETIIYENLVRMEFLQQKKDFQPFFNNESVRVTIKAYMSIPKSTSRKKREKMERKIIKPAKKPDADNIAKAVLDGLQDVAFKDDKQITTLTIFKRYAVTEPFVAVEIMEDI